MTYEMGWIAFVVLGLIEAASLTYQMVFCMLRHLRIRPIQYVYLLVDVLVIAWALYRLATDSHTFLMQSVSPLLILVVVIGFGWVIYDVYSIVRFTSRVSRARK